MKKIFTFILLVCIAILAKADHMSFMGIPIDGSITSFQSQLSSKGFKFIQKSEEGRLYKGKFFGETVSVFVYYDNKNKTVNSVLVIFPEDHLVPCRTLYDRLSRSLAEKYLLVEEKTNKGYLNPVELRESSFAYKSQDQILGLITLSEDNKYNDYWCTIMYYDNENMKKQIQSEKEDL